MGVAAARVLGFDSGLRGLGLNEGLRGGGAPGWRQQKGSRWSRRRGREAGGGAGSLSVVSVGGWEREWGDRWEGGGTTERGGGETEAAGWGGGRVYGLHKRVHIFVAFTLFSLIEHTNTRLEPACPVSSVRLASRISIRIH